MPSPDNPSKPVLRIASVSYLNARPLIWSLDRTPDVQLTLDVPSHLAQGLGESRYDVALLPVIDYQRLPNLTILPVGGIGSDGPTLTVRIFSRVPIPQIESLACDPDSHTSVALARIILARRYNLRPEFLDLQRAGASLTEARLLIGDKVICQQPQGFPHQLDLGHEWKSLTNLPFVFATWMARPNIDLRRAWTVLQDAKQQGLANIDRIITRHALPRGWPPDLAHRYLTQNLKFNIGPAELNAITHFHHLCHDESIISNIADLKLWKPAP
jgi:chorismate dehydratase